MFNNKLKNIDINKIQANENQPRTVFNEEKIEQFAEATKDWVAKKGRASYLGERAIGHIDPGAASSALLFEELVKVINQ